MDASSSSSSYPVSSAISGMTSLSATTTSSSQKRVARRTADLPEEYEKFIRACDPTSIDKGKATPFQEPAH
eukprot:12773198-Ditylum_brightwellii.AAC.1